MHHIEIGTLLQNHLNLLHILQVIKSWEVAYLDSLRPHKDTVLELRGLTPVTSAGNAAVILANGLIELDCDPGAETAGNLFDLTDVLDEASSGVLTANATPSADSNAPCGNLAVKGIQLGLLVAGGVWVEAAKLLVLLPG
ncbi:hypothetical protein HG530_004605 [Fusarium avenaceum]|nr:hypothetical protein HG530_004605 [Fusarium avenaceum]